MPSYPSLPQTLRDFLAQPVLKRLPRRLLVAVSGGADSVALLRSAALAGEELGWQVEALHCDHGLRPASKAEARFVDALCQTLGLTLYSFHGGIKAGSNLEERARLWRQLCYVQAAKQSEARLILLGQHAQDQAETLLLNLIRGAGATGARGMLPLAPLTGMPAVQLGRPFLGTLPQELRAYLKALKQPWKEDASNQDRRLARNRVRHAVLPGLIAINPQAVQNLAAFAARAQAAPRDQSLAGLLRLDAAARTRAQSVMAQGRGSTDLGRGWTLQVSAGKALVTHKALPTNSIQSPLLADNSVLDWHGWSIQLKPARVPARKLKEGSAFWFSSKMGSPRLIRAARPGERLEAFGLQGSKLVRDLLAEAKVPQWLRSQWPVLEAGGRLVAVLGIRRGQAAPVKAGETALHLTWKAPI